MNPQVQQAQLQPGMMVAPAPLGIAFIPVDVQGNPQKMGMMAIESVNGSFRFLLDEAHTLHLIKTMQQVHRILLTQKPSGLVIPVPDLSNIDLTKTDG